MSTMELKDLLTEQSEEPTTPVGPFIVLDSTHRCDACSAAAVAQIHINAEMPNIHLCGHHYRKNLTKFQELGYAVDVPDEFNYLFTDREIQARPATYGLTDRGSA